MPTTVWKFPLEAADTVMLSMPAGAVVLAVGVQEEPLSGYERSQLWALVDPDAPREARTFYVRGTGHPMGDAEGCVHVGTFQVAGGRFVGHVFDGGF